MSIWERWLERPQGLWFRKAVFQVHLWVGIGVGLYVLAISLSGSAIVFRRELDRKFSRREVTVVVPASGLRLSENELQRFMRRAYPSWEILSAMQSEPGRPDHVELLRGSRRIERLFDPYTGKDLGNPESLTSRALGWLTDLHDNLLLSSAGRIANGAGALLITLLAATGTLIWWPGVKNWQRSTKVSWKASWPRLNWDLHSAIGFWCSLFLFVWGISGICLCFPGALDSLSGGDFRFWITSLHFGRFNLLTEVVWTAVGLAPAGLALTGALMWWNRVLRKKLRHRSDRKLSLPAEKILASNSSRP